MTIIAYIKGEAAAAQQGSAIRVLLPPPHFPTSPPARHSEGVKRLRNLEYSTENNSIFLSHSIFQQLLSLLKF